MVKKRLISFGACVLVASALFGCSALDSSQDREKADTSARSLINAIAQGDAELASESLSKEAIDKGDIEASIHNAHGILDSPFFPSSQDPSPKGGNTIMAAWRAR